MAVPDQSSAKINTTTELLVVASKASISEPFFLKNDHIIELNTVTGRQDIQKENSPNSVKASSEKNYQACGVQKNLLSFFSSSK